MDLPASTVISDRYVLDSLVGPYPYYSLVWLDLPFQQIPPGYENVPEAWHSQEIGAARDILRGLGRLPLDEIERGIRIKGFAA